MHGTSLALMVAYSASTFQLTGKAEPQKKRAKMICKSVEKWSCIIYIYKGLFHKISAFAKRSKQQATKHTKMGFAEQVVQEELKSAV